MENGGDTEESQSVLREPWGLARLTKRACHIHLGEKEAQVLKGKQEWSPLPTGLIGVLPLQFVQATNPKVHHPDTQEHLGLGDRQRHSQPRTDITEILRI